MNYPLITSWQWHSTVFSILCNNNYALQWIFSNYIQLVGFNYEKFLFLDFIPGGDALQNCPYLNIKSVSDKEILKNSCNPLNFLISSIKEGYYIYGVFDESFMLKKQFKFPHELMIYGYNYTNKIFYVGDFTFEGRYSYQEVSFHDVILGFNNIKDNEDFLFSKESERKRGIFLLSPNLYNLVYTINKKLIIKSLNEYIHSKNPSVINKLENDFCYKPIFGISLYNELIKQINNKNFRYDIRSFHVFYDHKNLMLKRIEFLIENNYIESNIFLLNLFRDLMNNSMIIRNKMIKFIINHDEQILISVQNKLKKMQYQEIIAFNCLMEELEN